MLFGRQFVGFCLVCLPVMYFRAVNVLFGSYFIGYLGSYSF